MSVYSAAVSASESFFQVAGSVAQVTATAAQAAAPVVQAAAPAAQAAGPIATALGTAALSIGSSIFSVFGALNVATVVYKSYTEWDDSDLLNSLRKEDCGGLSKMTSDVEACYRKYLGQAVHRTANGQQYSNYLNRFDSCFYNRPERDCSWKGWWDSNKIFEAGKELKIDKQYLSEKV